MKEKIKKLENKNKVLKSNNNILSIKGSVFKEILERESFSTDHKKGLADYLITHYGISLGLALNIVGLSKTGYTYERMGKGDVEVYNRLEELARTHPGGSCRSYIKIMKDEGRGWNHKRIRRIYNALGLHERYNRYM